MIPGLYVRTANAGTDPDILLEDLGVIIASGDWTPLSGSTPAEPWAGSGNFTSVELRDSEDLYNQITASGLEWSKDAISLESPNDYKRDYMLVYDLSDDDFDFSGGSVTLPYTYGIPVSTPDAGRIAWDPDNDIMYVYTTSGWAQYGDFTETMPTNLTLLFDEDGDYSYVGEALPGTDTSTAAWRIYRLDESEAGSIELVKKYAGGTSEFDKNWDSRVGYSYT